MARLVEAMGAPRPARRRALRRRGGRGGAPRQGRPRHPDGARVPGAAGRDGRDLPRRRGRAGRGRHGRALALPPDRGRARAPSRPPRSRAGTRAARVFAAVALADKLDTLAGYFGLGESPTGSRDPFGLRRAGQGAVRAVARLLAPGRGERAPDLQALLARGGRRRTPALKQPADETRRGRRGVPARPPRVRARGARLLADEVAAVLAARREARRRWPTTRSTRCARAARPCSARAREAPRGLRGARRGLQAREEHPRPGSSRRPRSTRRSSRPTPSARLFAAVSRPRDGRRRLRGRACAASPALRAPVERFFDDVLVMAEDPRVRGNRLAFSSRRSHSSIASRTFRSSEVTRDSIRLLLRRRQGGRQQGHEGHARRQGLRPRRDDQRRRAGAAGLHDLDPGLQRLLRQRRQAPGRGGPADGRGAREARGPAGQEARRRQPIRCSSPCAAARSSRCRA